MSDNAKELDRLLLKELQELKEHQENVKEDKYFSQIEVDYLHFVTMFVRHYPKQQIIDQLNELYDQGVISAIRNPQGMLFDIRLK